MRVKSQGEVAGNRRHRAATVAARHFWSEAHKLSEPRPVVTIPTSVRLACSTVCFGVVLAMLMLLGAPWFLGLALGGFFAAPGGIFLADVVWAAFGRADSTDAAGHAD